VANYGDQTPGNTITVIDLLERRTERVIDLGEYTRPHGIEFLDRDHWFVVTSETKRALLKVSMRTGDVERVMDTKQDASHMVAVAPDKRRAWVANIGSGSVSAIDLESGEIAMAVPTGAGAEGLDVRPDGSEVWVANRSEDTITVIDARTMEVLETIDVSPDGAGPQAPGAGNRPRSFPIRLKFTPDGARALTTCALSGDVAVLDARERRITARIAMEAPAVEDAEGRLFQVPEGGPTPVGLLVDPRGRFAFVANTNADFVAVIDLETLAIRGHIPTGREPDGLAWTYFVPSRYPPSGRARAGIGFGVGFGVHD
jgi:YVTN family beta-propeller protein